MVFRLEAALVAGLICAASAAEFDVTRKLAARDRKGVLVLDDSGIAFRETQSRNPRHWRWTYDDIQQLTLGDRTIRIVTYRDRKWRLGIDQEFNFTLPAGAGAQSVDSMLRARLGLRYVSARAFPDSAPAYHIKAKLLAPWVGSLGTLAIGPAAVHFQTARPDRSRSWPLDQIDSVSSTGPLDLTLTVHERAPSSFGNRKEYRFQLHAPLDTPEYEKLWRKLNRAHLPAVLSQWE